MTTDSISIDWNGKSKCIRCGTPVLSGKDFCSKECEDTFFKA